MRRIKRMVVAWGTMAALCALWAPAVAAADPVDATDGVGTMPGLYGTDQVLVTGGPTWARIASTLDCDAVRAVLEAGDWQEIESFDQPLAAQAGLKDVWLLLGRGEGRAFARLRGLTGGCTGSVSRLVDRAFVASGAVDTTTTSTMIPVICIRTADRQVSAIAMFDVAGGRWARTEVTFTPVIGTRPLPAKALSDTTVLGKTSGSLFGLLASGKDPGGTELAPGGDFAGTIEVESVEPLAARLRLTGLATAAGKRQDLDMWIDCHLQDASRPPAPGDPVATASAPVSLHLEVNERTRITGSFGASADQRIVIDARLEIVVPGRYEGHATSSAEGTFTEADLSDFKGKCTGRWSGTQEVDLVGIVGTDGLQLALTAAAPPQVEYTKRCNVSTHTGDNSFPWGVAIGQTIDLAWPPGSPETDVQVVKNRVRGFGSQTWSVSIAPAP